MSAGPGGKTSTGSSIYNGAEHFAVGISPSFWAHVPLSIFQVHNLKLVDGINCIVRDSDNQFLPISKCLLVGTIVSVEYKSNGSVVYVLDDGSGMIDCLNWVNVDIETMLPPLLPSTGGDPSPTGVLQVGTFAKILGRIQCISVNGNNTPMSEDSNDARSSRCIREIHANLVQAIDPSAMLNTERRQWTRCESILHSSNPNKTICNANDMLERLGPEIRAQVADRSNLPSADDTLGAWKLFGTKCRCKLSYKEHLLYCHCHATPDPLDPDYQYRDRLLEKLLQMEKLLPCRDDGNMEPLRFQYRTVSNALEQEFGAKDDTQRVSVGAFRALREDGILHLLDSRSDTYLLISRERVLDQYFRQMAATDANRIPATAAVRVRLRQQRPSYLAKVPKARLDLVRRSLLQTDKPE